MKGSIYIFLAFFVIFLGGCADEGCMNPSSLNYDPAITRQCKDCCIFETVPSSDKTLTVHLTHEFGGLPLQKEVVYNVQSKDLTIQNIQYYITNITLLNTDGQDIYFSDYFYIESDSTVLNVGDLKDGRYSHLQFSIGVNPMENHEVPNAFDENHSLYTKEPSMFWDVNTGYKFFALDGTINLSSEPEQPNFTQLTVEIGTDEMLKQVILPIDQMLIIDDSFSGELKMNLTVDYKVILEAINAENYEYANIAYPVYMDTISDSFQEAFRL